jgi:hypothetical protein
MALAVPILDASIAVFRRWVRGEDLFRADGDHIHHRLLRMGLTPRRVVAVMYAVAAAFGAMSLLTMTARGQIVGMVIIASSVVTWIGVHQLGYAEFGEIQRTLRYGVGNQRRAMGNNVYLASLTHRFTQAHDISELSTLLTEAATRLDFHRVEVQFEGAGSQGLRAAFPPWEAARDVIGMQPSSTWRIPIAAGAGLLATVVLTRALTRQAEFEPTYFIHAIREGLGPSLLSITTSRFPPANGVDYITRASG